MKKLLFALLIASIIFASCSSSRPAIKKDCRGAKHYKQPGGFYL